MTLLPEHTWRIPNRNTNPIEVGDIIQRLSYEKCSWVIQIIQKAAQASAPSCQTCQKKSLKSRVWKKMEHPDFFFCESPKKKKSQISEESRSSLSRACFGFFLEDDEEEEGSNRWGGKKHTNKQKETAPHNTKPQHMLCSSSWAGLNDGMCAEREVEELYPFFEFIPLQPCAQTAQLISFKSFSSFVPKKGRRKKKRTKY